MARPKEKPVQIRRVTSKEDRKRPSVFMRLQTEEDFQGHALFEPDPELADNPGYFEYYDHWDQQGQAYVPCTGDRCPFCAANMNPSTRALTVWFFPKEKNPKEQLKVFTANYSTIGQLTDESEDEGGLLGKVVRIKRLSDRGEYRVKIRTDKPLTKTELKKLMKQVEDLNLVGMVERQLQVQMERLKAIDALEDDDDEEEDEPTPARKGKAITAAVDEDDEDEDEEEDEEEEDEEEDEDEEEEESDEDDEEDEDEDEEDEEDEAPTAIAGVFEVVKLNESDETIDVKDSDGTKLKMWFGEDVEWDADTLKKGVSANIEALQDDEGDWVITEITKKATRGRPKGTTKKK